MILKKKLNWILMLLLFASSACVNANNVNPDIKPEFNNNNVINLSPTSSQAKPTQSGSIVVEPEELALAVAETGQLKARVKLADGTENNQVVWTSENNKVALVNGQGVVQRVAEGDVLITVVSSQDTSIRRVVRVTDKNVGPNQQPSPPIPIFDSSPLGSTPLPADSSVLAPSQPPVLPSLLTQQPTATPMASSTPIPTPTPLPTAPPIPPPVPTGPISNSLGMTFVQIAAGTFQMGTPESDPNRYNDEISHPVTLTQSYYLQSTEVTQAQWQMVMNSNPSHFKGDTLPVEKASWNDIQAFIQLLNQRGEGTYRLPTEAEWEYAARAGSQTAWACGSSESCLGQIAWFGSNAGDQTHPVMQKQPNAWGLYDMHGNVMEWCQDWYGAYPSGDVNDPQGPSSGAYRIVRGGGWYDTARSARLAARGYHSPSGPHYAIGFRLVRIP